jgi:histidinol dehydrogenase
MKNAQGALVGERFDPFERVGVYVPGGTAPLVSTAIMTCTLAQAAGCPHIVVTTPTGPDGRINDALHHALVVAGATEIYRVGGAQAIGALAYGTKSIPPVQKIFGPGNAYVVEAKRQVVGRVAIDLLPGPSEILILADATANPAWIASDLLAQAEHGQGQPDDFRDKLRQAPLRSGEASRRADGNAQQAGAPRRCARTRRGAHPRKVDERCDHDREQLRAGAPLDRSKEELKIAQAVSTAGAIFLGGYSPVAAGDFLAGPSHTLPTGGAGRSFPGLTVDMFQRRTSFVRLDERSLKRSVGTIETFSAIEGLDAHGRSASIRFQR